MQNSNACTCVRTVVDLEILETREGLATDQTRVRLFVGVGANVDQHFVPVTHTHGVDR